MVHGYDLMDIVLNINNDDPYVARYIVLEDLPIRYKSLIFAHSPDISFDISLSNMRTVHPM